MSTPAEWKRAYGNGATIEEVALDAGVTTQTVRKHLAALGTEMRPPGQRPGTTSKNHANTKAPGGSHDAIVHIAFKGVRGVHRRRGNRRAA